jgi:hypothetical protein
MNLLSIIESWVAKVLLTDSIITDIVGENIYYGAADTDEPDIFVVYSYVDSTPFYNLGTKRYHGWAEYDIMVWQKGKDTRDMKTVANRVDDLFSIARNLTHTQNGETYYFYSRLNRSLSQKDISTPPTIWRGLGGTYKVSATKQ